MDQPRSSIITVTLNTAIDRVLEVEGFAIGAHLPATETMRYPAGKGVNVSRALAQLGRDSVATGFVGQDEAARFEQILADAGPGRAMCQLLSTRGQTRENITILDRAAHSDTHIRTAGYEVSRRDMQRIVSKLGLLAREGAVVAFSGSMPRGMTQADFDTLIYVALGGGAKVVLDVGGRLLAESTSLDLRISEEAGGAEGAGGTSGGPKMLWAIKPNLTELAEALGVDQLKDEAEILAAGRRLAERVTWVVVTLGPGGAILFGDGGAWRARCEVAAEQIVSTVGSGDSLLAGLLDAQAAGLEPEAALRHGVAAATANALRPDVAQFELSVVRELESRVRVEAV